MVEERNGQMNRTLYLNNSGSKWIIQDSMKFYELEVRNGIWYYKLRTADYYESFGNFALVCYRKNGRRKREFFDDFYKYKNLPIVIPSTEFFSSFFEKDINAGKSVYDIRQKIIESTGGAI